MFYTEEDITPAVKAAEEVFGIQAQYIHGGKGTESVFIRLLTPKFGPIWYGDFQGNFTKAKTLADVLSSRIGQRVQVQDLATELVV